MSNFDLITVKDGNVTHHYLYCFAYREEGEQIIFHTRCRLRKGAHCSTPSFINYEVMKPHNKRIFSHSVVKIGLVQPIRIRAYQKVIEKPFDIAYMKNPMGDMTINNVIKGSTRLHNGRLRYTVDEYYPMGINGFGYGYRVIDRNEEKRTSRLEVIKVRGQTHEYFRELKTF